MDADEYMQLKKELSEELVGKQESKTEESVKTLSETFKVPQKEAYKVLNDCDNDLKMAAKVLRMKDLEL